jgi:TonB family protein
VRQKAPLGVRENRYDCSHAIANTGSIFRPGTFKIGRRDASEPFLSKGDSCLQRSQRLLRSAVIFLPALIFAAVSFGPYTRHAFAEDHPERKIRIRVEPVYPDIARKMKLHGIVRIEVVVSPNGNVKETKVIGGHPILVTAAVDAVKKWKFDPANAETTGTLEVKFDPGN